MSKQILMALLAAACLQTASAQMIKGEKTFGPKIGYASHNNSATAGLAFSYAFSSRVRLAPEIGTIFRHNNEDAFTVDVNVNTPFDLGTSVVALYPLAGLQFASWATHGVSNADLEDVTTHTNRFGVNLGAGFDFRCTSTLRLNIEVKYTLMKAYSGVFATVGISYVF